MRPPHWKITPEVPLPRLRTITQLWRLAAVLGGLGVASLAIDAPLARWIARGDCPAFLEKLCGLSETFAHGVGIAVIAVFIAVLDPVHRHVVPRVVAAALGSGLLANAFKLLIARTRPHHFDLQADALDSFAGWFPLLGNTSWEQGFPSSHAATAAGLAIALACLYPRGRWLFPLMAGLAGLQRVLAEAHFLSDVLWGSAVGCIFAPLCVYGGRISKAFDRLEQRLSARQSYDAAAPASRMLAPQSGHPLPAQSTDVDRAA
ncbi:MAG: phosphatase PAP2 family protein [Pirellulales bacterium]